MRLVSFDRHKGSQFICVETGGPCCNRTNSKANQLLLPAPSRIKALLPLLPLSNLNQFPFDKSSADAGRQRIFHWWYNFSVRRCCHCTCTLALTMRICCPLGVEPGHVCNLRVSAKPESQSNWGVLCPGTKVVDATLIFDSPPCPLPIILLPPDRERVHFCFRVELSFVLFFFFFFFLFSIFFFWRIYENIKIKLNRCKKEFREFCFYFYGVCFLLRILFQFFSWYIIFSGYDVYLVKYLYRL